MSSLVNTTQARVVPVLAAGVVAISFAAVFFKLAQPTHPLVAAGLRLLIAALLLAPFTLRAFVKGRLSGRVVRTALVGGFAYAIHFGAWVWSLELTSVAASVTLVTATPLMLAGASFFTRRDPPSKRTWLALAVATLGIIVVGGGDHGTSFSNLVGDALALIGAAGMAVYLAYVRRLGAFDVWSFAGLVTPIAAVILLGLAVSLGHDPIPASPEAFYYLVLAALVPQLIGHSALTWALRHTPATSVGIATLGEPVGATLLAWWLLTESPSPITLVGCVLTLVGVAISVTSTAPPEPEPRR